VSIMPPDPDSKLAPSFLGSADTSRADECWLMARTFAQFQLRIWVDDEWLAPAVARGAAPRAVTTRC
jgi:hypothetical protein